MHRDSSVRSTSRALIKIYQNWSQYERMDGLLVLSFYLWQKLQKGYNKTLYYISLYLYAMPIKLDSVFSVLNLKERISIHSAQFGWQVVLWPTPYQGHLDWCWGWSGGGTNGCWLSVFLLIALLSITIKWQQLGLLLLLALPDSWNGAGPLLYAKRQVSCAGGFTSRQGWPCLQAPPQVLLFGGAHALEFAGEPGSLVLCVVDIVSWQQPFPAASTATVTQQRGGGSRCNRQSVGWRQWTLLLLLFDTVGRRRNLKGVVELGVINSEEALFQWHDREEAMTPQDFILCVRRPCLACHTYNREKLRAVAFSQKQTKKKMP